jgi:hypothetical protein
MLVLVNCERWWSDTTPSTDNPQITLLCYYSWALNSGVKLKEMVCCSVPVEEISGAVEEPVSRSIYTQSEAICNVSSANQLEHVTR